MRSERAMMVACATTFDAAVLVAVVYEIGLRDRKCHQRPKERETIPAKHPTKRPVF